jgi:hypothetical protein
MGFFKVNKKSITIGGVNIGSKGIYGNTPFGRIRLDSGSTPPPPDPLTLPDTPCPTLQQTRLRTATRVAYILWTVFLMLLACAVGYPAAALPVPMIMWLIARKHRRIRWEYNIAKWRDYHKS